MTNKALAPLATLFAALTVSAVIALKYYDTELYKVKSNKSILICAMVTGKIDTVIDSDLVTDRIDGRWIFVNGSASRCKTLSVDKLL